jgi:hypothetical protein
MKLLSLDLLKICETSVFNLLKICETSVSKPVKDLWNFCL